MFSVICGIAVALGPALLAVPPVEEPLAEEELVAVETGSAVSASRGIPNWS
jgi:hypothetical protein